MKPDELRTVRRSIEEIEMLKAYGKGPEAQLAWLHQLRETVAALLDQIDAEIDKLNP